MRSKPFLLAVAAAWLAGPAVADPLGWQQLGLFAPIDTQAGSPFFAPVDPIGTGEDDASRSGPEIRLTPPAQLDFSREVSPVFDVPGIDGFFEIAPPQGELPVRPSGEVFEGDTRRYAGIPRDLLIVDGERPGEAIPEPAGALLFAGGFALVALHSRRRR